MPRCARKKSPESIYHVMCRSISEFLLFRDDEDKDYYLELLSRYTKKYMCSIYAYCLMDTHIHLHFDPKGADISQFMHSLNTAYVRYYNYKYKRHGSVFAGRFKSKIVDTDSYSIVLSAYIHNNPHDIEEYYGKEEQYKYSSYGIYLGLRKDVYKILDKRLMYKLFGETGRKFAEKYVNFVSRFRDVECLKKMLEKYEIEDENEYRSERVIINRTTSPSLMIAKISEKIMEAKENIFDYSSNNKEYRSFCAYILRVLCGMKYKEICRYLYNITLSGCSFMCEKGYRLRNEKCVYKELFDELVEMNIVV